MSDHQRKVRITRDTFIDGKPVAAGPKPVSVSERDGRNLISAGKAVPVDSRAGKLSPDKADKGDIASTRG